MYCLTVTLRNDRHFCLIQHTVGHVLTLWWVVADRDPLLPFTMYRIIGRVSMVEDFAKVGRKWRNRDHLPVLVFKTSKTEEKGNPVLTIMCNFLFSKDDLYPLPYQFRLYNPFSHPNFNRNIGRSRVVTEEQLMTVLRNKMTCAS